MRVIATLSLLGMVVLSACFPAPTPPPSAVAGPTGSLPPPSIAAEGALRLAVVRVDAEVVRTADIVLVGRVENAGGEIVADLGRVLDGRDVPLAGGWYRFVGETHGFGVGGMGRVQGRCGITFTVEPGGMTALTVQIAWNEPCSIAAG